MGASVLTSCTGKTTKVEVFMPPSSSGIFKLSDTVMAPCSFAFFKTVSKF